jgi:signal transduction histidine kinase
VWVVSGLHARLRRLAHTPVPVQDGLFAAALCALDLSTQWDTRAGDRWIGDGPLPWQLVTAYAALGYAVLAWRRRYPYAVFAVLCVHSVVGQLLLPYRPLLGLLVAFYTVSSRSALPRALGALAAVAGVSALYVADEVLAVPPAQRPEMLVVSAIMFVIVDLSVLGVGQWVCRSRHDLRDMDRRRLVAARSAVAEERVRIARDLHDIVAHSVTVMVLQAAGARRILAAQPGQVDRALADIEATGRQAMDELRRLLGVLVNADPATARDVEELGPHPGLNDLPAVLERVSGAGLSVAVTECGEPRPLDPSVDLAAHRVVTEGLTNALKHGGLGTRVEVLLDWRDGRLAVHVTDDGSGHRPTGTPELSGGHGLAGLRERVRAVGGELDVGPVPGGGFRISATLPTAYRREHR